MFVKCILLLQKNRFLVEHCTKNDLVTFNKEIIKPFVPNAPFLYPLETPENRLFSAGRERVN